MPPLHHPRHRMGHDAPPPPPRPPHHEPASFLTERDLRLVEELLENPAEARELFDRLAYGPPEMGAVGCLVLRLFERMQEQLPGRSLRRP